MWLHLVQPHYCTNLPVFSWSCQTVLGVQQASFSWLSTVFTAEARKDPRRKTIWEMIWKWQPVVKTRQNVSLNMEQVYPLFPRSAIAVYLTCEGTLWCHLEFWIFICLLYIMQLNCPRKSFREAMRSGRPIVSHKLNANNVHNKSRSWVQIKTGVHPCNYSKIHIDKVDRFQIISKASNHWLP